MISTTEEQLNKEKEVQDIADLYDFTNLSHDDADEKISDLISNALKQHIFSSEDIYNYNQRRDAKDNVYGIRSHIKFAMDLKKWNKEEEITFNYFIKWMKSKGKKINYKLLGSDGKGYVIIANFKERQDSPNKPDYEIDWPCDSSSLEVKNFGKRIWLKIDNLKKYREWESYIAMRFNGNYYFFSKNISAYLLKNMPYPPVIIHGKKSIIITENGKNAHFSLQKIFSEGLVKQM